MNENKGNLKMIHIILMGCFLILGLVCGVIYANKIIQYNQVENEELLSEEIQNGGVTASQNIRAENKDYFSKEIEVPEKNKVIKKENCKNELGLKEAKIDNEKLILKFELDTKNNPIKNFDNITITNCAKLEIGNEIYYLNDAYENVCKLINKKENVYELYVFYDVEGLDYDKKIKFSGTIDINEWENYFSDVDTKVFEIGTWDLELALDENMKTNSTEKYAIKDLIIKTEENEDYGGRRYEFLQIRILEDNILMSGVLLDYTTEPGILYTLEFFDKDGNSLMLDGKELLIGGVRQDILLKKFDLNEEVIIKFEESVYGTNEIISKSETTLNFADYIKNDKEIQKNMQTAYNEDLSLSYDSTKFELDSDNAFIEVGYENLKYPINAEYISYYEYSGDIYIYKYENIFNESLDEMFENRQKLAELGIYSERTEEYILGVDIGPYDEWGSPADVKFYEFTDAEIMDIYNGKTITKDDMKFDKSTYIKHSEGAYGYEMEYKNFGEVTIDGKDAITYVIDKNGFAERRYIFMVNDCIYEIKIPIDLKLENDYYEFIENITFK